MRLHLQELKVNCKCIVELSELSEACPRQNDSSRAGE